MELIHQRVAKDMNPYLDSVRRTRYTDKVVNDAVWGTVRLFPWEVAVLDSPVMQRLRSIRQLGVIHWVYPNAGHSRFEHSIGALHQVQALIDGLQRTSGRAGDNFIPDADVKLLRLTALLHDCGHVVFSHVGERFVKTVAGMTALQEWIGKAHQVAAKPSETLAAIIIRSPAFVSLLSEPRVAADFIADAGLAVRQMAAMILGAGGVLARGWLGELISGPYDADKLDYMVRDAQMAGLPPAVDVRRITDKIHCVRVGGQIGGSGAAIAALSAQRLHPGVEGSVLALPRSGTAVLRELARARASLFEKMYYHHKVRALEVAAVRALHERSSDIASARPLWWLEDGDEVVIAGSVGQWSLRWRRLPKRAAFVAPPAGVIVESEDADGDDIWSELHVPKFKALLSSKIAAKAAALAHALGAALDAPPEFDFPDWERGVFDERALVGDAAAELAHPRPQEAGERSKTAEGYAREGAFVYASAGDLEIAHVATLMVLREFGIERSIEMLDRTNVDRDALGRIEARLVEAGVNGLPEALKMATPPIRKSRAMENFLRSAWSRIEALGETFGQFQPLGGGAVGPSQIAAYLRQFESPDLARAMLRVLESVRLLGRKELVEALRVALQRCRDAGSPVDVICPIGSSGDSSAWSSYFVGDLDGTIEVMPLEMALDEPYERILLWDDFCGQSGHAATTLSQWCGDQAPQPAVLLDEKLARPLSSTRLARLGKVSVRIGFAAARPAGIEELRKYVDQLGLHDAAVIDPTGTVAVADHDGFLDADSDDPTVADPEMRRELADFLSARMRAVAKAEGWPANRVEERLLGYGGHHHRLVFFYNVPTVTLTALWAGAGSGVWTPLFPRRKKAKKKTVKDKAKNDGEPAGLLAALCCFMGFQQKPRK